MSSSQAKDPAFGERVRLIFTKPGRVEEGTFLGRKPNMKGEQIAQLQTKNGMILDETDCWWEPLPVCPTSVNNQSTVTAIASMLLGNSFIPVFKKK